MRSLSETSRDEHLFHRRVEALRRGARATLRVDAAIVGHEQPDFFGTYVRRLRRELGTSFDDLTKVAMLHHHLNPQWGQQTELKPFESIIDAARVKQALVDFGFDIVLHGHKHINRVSVDASMAPPDGHNERPLCIVSGGTAANHPSSDDHRSFKILEVAERNASASVTVCEVPLWDTVDPGKTIERRAKRYQVDIATKASVVDPVGVADTLRSVHTFVENRLKDSLRDLKALALSPVDQRETWFFGIEKSVVMTACDCNGARAAVYYYSGDRWLRPGTNRKGWLANPPAIDLESARGTEIVRLARRMWMLPCHTALFRRRSRA